MDACLTAQALWKERNNTRIYIELTKLPPLGETGDDKLPLPPAMFTLAAHTRCKQQVESVRLH